ncbi:MAG: DUF1800 domain-containing protein, partial [Planctomycetes bacterium]|nr:DUF1800 domain-containing protein [Planctomycetota bacterium]
MASLPPDPDDSRPRQLAIVLMTLFSMLTIGRVDAQPPELHRHFVRGDANQDGAVQVADPIFLLGYLFSGGAPLPCDDAADANDDEEIDLADAISLLHYLFGSAPPPPPPSVLSGCGPDPTLDSVLSCNEYAPCSNQTTAELAAHVLRRLGYGPTPERLAHVVSIGHAEYIEEQLHPELDLELDNVELNSRLSALTPQNDFVSLLLWQIDMALYSRNQLREALTDFWENHFNTDLVKIVGVLQSLDFGSGPLYTPEEALAEGTSWEWLENAIFRAGALGSFENLLIASAAGRPMLVYLDGAANTVAAPNENYARELVELHTMGVDNGYTQVDIEEIARCFTGWTVRKKAPADAQDPLAPPVAFDDPTGVWAFHFSPLDHDYGAKSIFAGTFYELDVPSRAYLSPEGILDGFEVLQHLATLPQTAEFVSRKLIQKLVSDDPPTALVASALATWLATDGDLRAVVETIVTSPEFLDPMNRWNKIETAFEFLISTLRALDADTSGIPVIIG